MWLTDTVTRQEHSCIMHVIDITMLIAVTVAAAAAPGTESWLVLL